MDVREKLVELLYDANKECSNKNCVTCRHQDKKFFCKIHFYIDKMIANGVTVQEWISVKDRLPEQGQEIIVYSGGVLKPTVFAYQFWNKHYDSWARITHWMPLPEPPKGE